MENLLNEKPSEDLSGRFLYTTQFVNTEDINRKSVLDIGCGFGWFELWSLSCNVMRIVGTEIDEKSLSTAKGNIKNERAAFQVATVESLKFNSKFDTVVSWEVIEHIPEYTETLMFQKINSLLKPNGVFYLSTPYNSWRSKLLDPAWWVIGHRHYSKESLEKLGNQYGFELEEVFIKGKWWELFTVLNLYISKWIFLRPPVFDAFFNKNRDREYAAGDGFALIFLKFRKGRDV
jgi:SAM-dependent methyltransferase